MKTTRYFIFGISMLFASVATFGQTNHIQVTGTTAGVSGNIYHMGGNVGIGRTNPETKLHIDGTGGAPSSNYSTLAQRSNLILSSINGLGTNTKLLTGIGNSNYVWMQAFNSSANLPKSISLNGIGGNVGIGRNNPETILHVDGNGGIPSNDYSSLSQKSNFILSSISGLETNTMLLAGIGNSNYVWLQAFNSIANLSKDIILNGVGGNVGIGTTAPDAKLTVAGKIKAQEVQVTADAGADFVFAEDYALRDLNEVEQFVKENKHLPEIAPAKEMQENGVNMGELQIKLLQKIEELTLYVIELKKENEAMKEENKAIKESIENLKN